MRPSKSHQSKRNFRHTKTAHCLKYTKANKCQNKHNSHHHTDNNNRRSYEVEKYPDEDYYTIHHYDEGRRRYDTSEEEITRLDELPPKVLEKVFSIIDIWHLKRIREASRFFLATHDSFLIHTFRQAVNLVKREGHLYESAAVLLGLDAMTHYYLQAGYTSEIGGCLISMFRNIHADRSKDVNGTIRSRFQHLMKVVDLRAFQSNRISAALLYTTTLVRVLKFLPNVHITCENPQERTCIITFLEFGPWLVSMAPSNHKTWHQKNRYFLLSLLADVAIGSRISSHFRRSFDIEDIDMFGYGNDQKSQMRLQLKIVNSPCIVGIIEQIINDGDYEFTWPVPHLDKDIEISVKFACTNFHVGFSEQFLDITKNMFK